MVLALDVFYGTDTAKGVGVLFDWEVNEPKKVFVEYFDKVEEYVPGEFYKRELPCLIKIIEKMDITTIEAIIIDGYVYINNEMKLGLGGILWKELHETIPVIGVAKTSFMGNKNTVSEVLRGKSKNPLFISSVDYSIEKASAKIKSMKGEFRIPAVLKLLDTLTKENINKKSKT